MIALDPDRRVLILQFLTHSVDLFVALRRSNDAASVMRALGALIARLIVATSGPPVDGDDVAARERAALLAGWPKVAAWAGEFGVPRTSHLDRAIAAVTDCYANGEPASLTQGDPAPSNVAFTTDGQARLVDFEYGAQRHALADLSQWWIRCPLPEPWYEVLVDVVRSELLDAGVYDSDRSVRRRSRAPRDLCSDVHVHVAAHRSRVDRRSAVGRQLASQAGTAFDLRARRSGGAIGAWSRAALRVAHATRRRIVARVAGERRRHAGLERPRRQERMNVAQSSLR